MQPEAALTSRKKLGQILVERGWITVEQLTRALQTQNTVGGKIGTCLLEMRVLSEDLLLKALSDQLGVPAAEADDLQAIPRDVTHLIPSKLALRCQAVPFRRLGGRLDVALLDVNDLDLQDELAFAAGKRLQIHVANEARLYDALQKYYGASCPSRFSSLLNQLDKPGGAALRKGPRPSSPRRTPTVEELGDLIEERAPDSHDATDTQPIDDTPETVEREAPRWRAAPDDTQIVSTPAPTTRAPAVPSSDDLVFSFKLDREEVQQLLDKATNREEVAQLLLEYLSEVFTRVALFSVQRGQVRGWRGIEVDPKLLSEYSVGFDEPSLFLNLKTGCEFYLGALPPMSAHAKLTRCWGGSLPQVGFFLPVRIQDRLVAVIYGDRGDESLSNLDLESLQELAGVAGSALERCIRQRKARPSPPPSRS